MKKVFLLFTIMAVLVLLASPVFAESKDKGELTVGVVHYPRSLNLATFDETDVRHRNANIPGDVQRSADRVNDPTTSSSDQFR